MDHAPGGSVMPCGQTADEEEALQHGKVVFHGLSAQAQVARQVAGVQQLRTAQCEQLQQSSNLVDVPHLRHVLHVSFDHTAQVLPMPLTGAPRWASQRFGIAAGHQTFRQRRPRERLGANRRHERAGQDVADEAPRGALFFRFRERLQAYDFHASRQGLGDFRQQQEVRRAGEQEAPRTAVSINGKLDDRQQLRRLLDLVQGRLGRQAVHEAGRVAGSRCQIGGIVQTDEGPCRSELAGESGFSALARPKQADYRRIRQRRFEDRYERTSKQCLRFGHVWIVVAADCRLWYRRIAGLSSGRLPVKVAADCRFW